MPFCTTQQTRTADASLTLEQHLARVETLQQQKQDDRGLSLRDQYKLQSSLEVLSKFAKEQKRILEQKDPLGNANLSYYQTLKVNSWLRGHLFLIDFDSNRGGKTAASVIRIHVFCNPPSPKCQLWQPRYENNPLTQSRPHPHQLLPPPAIHTLYAFGPDDPLNELDPYKSHLHPDNLPIFLEAVRVSPMLAHLAQDIDPRTGIWHPTDLTRLLSSYDPLRSENLNLEKPLPYKHDVWHGSPDHKKFKKVCAKAWHEWSPPGDAWVKRYVEHDGLLELAYPSGIRLNIVSMSYDSPAEKFASDAVRFILLTEGPKVDQWEEINIRFEYPALGSWDYTVADPSNTNSSAHYAEQVFKKKQHLPLNPIVFQGFGIDFIPSHILPPKKRAEMLLTYKDKPEGKARIYGQFYTTTPRALNNLDRDLHCIPITLREVRQSKFNKFDNDPFIYFRGYDEGTDSPSACVWGALAPDNTWYIYRAWQQNQLSIGQRCERIISLSGNERKQRHPGRSPAAGYRSNYTNADAFYYESIPSGGERITMTVADYHLFKKDQVTGRTHAMNYVKEGLILRASITEGPETRALLLNKMLEPFVPSEQLNPSGQFGRMDCLSGLQPRAKIYFLINEPGVAEMIDEFEEWYWERFLQGENKGQPKDKVADKNDHLADALSYMVLSPFRWSPILAKQGYSNQYQSRPDEKYSLELKEALEEFAFARY